MLNLYSPFIRVLFLFLAFLGGTNGQQFVSNLTWPAATCGSTMARDSDGSPCDSFCGMEGTGSVAGPYRSTYDDGTVGYQYQVCACNASVGLFEDSVTVNFRTDTEEACKYDEIEIDLPNTSNETCSDVGLDDFNATRCFEYCNDVVFKDFIDLNDVDGGWKGNLTGGCRCFWGGVAIDACSKSIDENGGTNPSISGGVKAVGFLTTAAATLVSVVTAFALEMVI
jgi:hypothetical protein